MWLVPEATRASRNVSDIPPVALQHGAKAARLVDCRDALVPVAAIPDQHPMDADQSEPSA